MFCKYCGSKLKDDALFCGNCGKQVKVVQPTVPQPTVTVEQPKSVQKKMSKAVIIIPIVIGIVLALGLTGAYFFYEKTQEAVSSNERVEIRDSKKLKKHKAKKEKEEKKKEKEAAKKDKKDEVSEDDLGVMMADNWESQSIDMTGKILYWSPDGSSINKDSYWEFKDATTASLNASDGSGYDVNYLILEGKLGMLYTEFKFPEYGLKYEELERATEANKKELDDCEYVIISFTDMSLKDVENDGDYKPMFFYGVKYKEDGETHYSVVGNNTAEYYYFIEEGTL